MQHHKVDTILTFSKEGHDPFIDFLKGFSIVCVILNHCLPKWAMDYSAFFFWGISAVPIFILIQVFHAYKGGIRQCNINFRRVWLRVLRPFFLCQLVILLLLAWQRDVHTPQALLAEVLSLVKCGGYGPGAYYPWIYVQIAVLIPCFSILFRFKHIRAGWICVFFIALSQGAETLCALIPLPQLAYRLLFIRYIFLFYLGYLMATKGFTIRWTTLLMATLCLAFAAYIVYWQPDLHPWIYPFVNPVCHWFCYLYIVYLLLFLLKKLFDSLPSHHVVSRVFQWAGVRSYELFLLQMIFFTVI